MTVGCARAECLRQPWPAHIRACGGGNTHTHTHQHTTVPVRPYTKRHFSPHQTEQIVDTNMFLQGTRAHPRGSRYLRARRSGHECDATQRTQLPEPFKTCAVRWVAVYPPGDPQNYYFDPASLPTEGCPQILLSVTVEDELNTYASVPRSLPEASQATPVSRSSRRPSYSIDAVVPSPLPNTGRPSFNYAPTARSDVDKDDILHPIGFLHVRL